MFFLTRCDRFVFLLANLSTHQLAALVKMLKQVHLDTLMASELSIQTSCKFSIYVYTDYSKAVLNFWLMLVN